MKHAAAGNKANTETNGAKDENNATEDDNAEEPKVKPKSKRSGVHRCQGPTNKAPASQRTTTRVTNTNQHPEEQHKAPQKKATHQRRRPPCASAGPLGSPKGTQLVADRGKSNETLADPINLEQMRTRH
jgi:hypothetical protein